MQPVLPSMCVVPTKSEQLDMLSGLEARPPFPLPAWEWTIVLMMNPFITLHRCSTSKVVRLLVP